MNHPAGNCVNITSIVNEYTLFAHVVGVSERSTTARQAVEKSGELKAGQRRTGETNSISSIPHGEARNSFLRNDGIAMLLNMA
jgi:hypothetical protein